MKTRRVHGRVLAAMIWATAVTVCPAQLQVTDVDGRIEVRDAGQLVFGWQHENLKEPKGGEKFTCSAFVHPLATPSGFVLTDVQPGDHLHHLGVWWPWKLVTVDGRKHVTWEMQKGEGRQVGAEATVTGKSLDEVVLDVKNQHQIKPKDGEYRTVVAEDTTLRFAKLGDDGYVLDITIGQRPVGEKPVEISKYRYSGFAWRGTPKWTKDTSRMRTSGGHDRDNANGQEAHWVMVDGATKNGKATMLMMSAAGKEDGTPERLRVWNSKMHHGMPFVNFNPVVKESILLTPERKEVSLRRYRIVVADREITPEQAEEMWKAWK